MSNHPETDAQLGNGDDVSAYDCVAFARNMEVSRDKWKAIANAFANAHYILAPDLRAEKHREALEAHIAMMKFGR